MKNKRNINYATQEYWDNNYKDFKFYPIPPNENPVRKWLNDNIHNKGGTVFEAGCFPGRYLEFFGHKGFEISGIDLTPEVTKSLVKWFQSLNYKIGNFYKGDFLEFKTNKKYDIVCSFGFIEHFSQYQEVIKKQASLVKDGGLIIIEVPNFRGIIQRYLHWSLDRENYKRHNISAMKLGDWKKIIKKMDFEIIWCGNIGGFDFWHEDLPKNKHQEKRLERLYKNLPKRRKQLHLPSSIYSPYIGLIARKL